MNRACVKQYTCKLFFISIIAVLSLSLTPPVRAQRVLNDSATISLLTASPWDGAIYALYGHTAIRVQDDSTGVDAVYNYGYFDSSQPGFIYHFMRGKTDYILGVTSFSDFISEYSGRGQQVVEQQLNLIPNEKQLLYNALEKNSLPENREYRYNYFLDNCATRPRDMVEAFVKGDINYPKTQKEQSYRDLVGESLNNYPWYKFGVDLLIGSGADSIIGVREKMFMPSYLMDSFEGAIIHRSDTLSMPLVKYSEELLVQDEQVSMVGERWVISPLLTAFGLLLLSVIISFSQILKMNKNKLPRIYDTVLFALVGIGGLIVFFLMFFSIHPATYPNWNLIWLHPIALLVAPFFWVKSAQKGIYFYHFINFVLLALFLLFWWLIPQQMPLATIPFSMSLWIRSATNLFMERKMRIKNKQYTSSREMKAAWGH